VKNTIALLRKKTTNGVIPIALKTIRATLRVEILYDHKHTMDNSYLTLSIELVNAAARWRELRAKKLKTPFSGWRVFLLLPPGIAILATVLTFIDF